MTRRTPILAGTALGLLMASSAMVSAQPVALTGRPVADAPLILVQGEENPALERLKKRRERQRQQNADGAEEAQPETEAAPAEEPAAEAAPAEAAPAEAAPEEPAPAEAAPAEAAPAEAAPAEAAPEDPAPAEAAPAEAAPAEAAPADPAPAEPAPAEAPADAAPADAQATEPAAEQPKRRARRERNAPAEAEAPADPATAPAEQAAPAAQPEQPPIAAEPVPADQPPIAAEPVPTDQPATAEQPAEAPAAVEGETVQGDDAEARAERRARRQRERAEQEQQADTAPAAPPPADDKAAQEAAQPESVEPVTAERGTRREGERRERRRERREGADVLSEIAGRVILELGDQVVVESDEQPRLSRDAREVFYEDLPRGRVRETIIRANGVQVVTVRNRFGDVIRRSRITPDGREYVLVYAEERDEGEQREWIDPGDELPPLRLSIPREEYILEAETASTSEDYYEFLDQPPVEKVERLYSVDEVKRSARVRDKTRRIDLDTITFEFGSAEIPESEINKLEGVATAMERLLGENPAETFLIEGHTDAVGSDLANLALSDRRAEAVAQALTDVFALPPENLTTQGYGEEYLKVNTDGPERENRRVGIRRITALVAPVASAQ